MDLRKIIAKENKEKDQIEDFSPILKKDQFNVHLDGYEGPLEILLELVKKQKVDISNVSILPLVDQYLEYIKQNQLKNLNVAASYLVMAAWLTFLKSKMLLPVEEEEEEEFDQTKILKIKLLKLDIIKKMSQLLFKQKKLGEEILPVDISTEFTLRKKYDYHGSFADLIKSYAKTRSNHQNVTFKPKKESYSFDEARKDLTKSLPELKNWTNYQNIFNIEANEVNSKKLSLGFFVILEKLRVKELSYRQNIQFGDLFIINNKYLAIEDNKDAVNQ